MSNEDTPRTDANYRTRFPYVDLELCRQLERELNAANERVRELEDRQTPNTDAASLLEHSGCLWVPRDACRRIERTLNGNLDDAYDQLGRMIASRDEEFNRAEKAEADLAVAKAWFSKKEDELATMTSKVIVVNSELAEVKKERDEASAKIIWYRSACMDVDRKYDRLTQENTELRKQLEDATEELNAWRTLDAMQSEKPKGE